MKKQNGEQHHAARDAETTIEEGLQEAASFTDKSVAEVFTVELGDGSQVEKRFTGMNVSEWLFPEIFAGAARISKVARNVGIQKFFTSGQDKCKSLTSLHSTI